MEVVQACFGTRNVLVLTTVCDACGFLFQWWEDQILEHSWFQNMHAQPPQDHHDSESDFSFDNCRGGAMLVNSCFSAGKIR